LKQWVEGAAGELGGVDTLVCNVSALAVGDTPETWEKSFRVDMMHTVNSIAAALPYLEKSQSASIVIISSVSGFEVDFAAGSYGAFKAALIHYAKGLSNQLVGKDIRVNAVSPGNTYFEGGIWQNIERGMPDLYKTAMSLNPTGRMGTPQEVAAGVVFLASPVAGRISGTNLTIDGALTKAV
jgi:NAD(P)-dependent dehydrogenase (short-subunit alcohol dehydrogenase family)